VSSYGKEFGLVLGPFGALMTLVFSLTSAPASQPRNVVLGQLLSLFVAYGFGRTSIDSRIKACLSTSISISLMARLGITHPPAGASAMIFSSGLFSLAQVGIMLLANVIAVILGAWCNNISDKRQYPTSWHIAPLFSYLRRGVSCLDELITCSLLDKKTTSSKDESTTPPHKHDDSSSVPPVPPFTVANKEVMLARRQQHNTVSEPNTSPSMDDTKNGGRWFFFSTISNSCKRKKLVSNSSQRESANRDYKRALVNDEHHVQGRDYEGTIELTAVLAQARNPLFLIDHDTSLTIHPMSGDYVPEGRKGVHSYYVVDDQSHGDNSMIKLSDVIAAAAKDSSRPIFLAHHDGTNQSFVRLTRVLRDDDDDDGKRGVGEEEPIDLSLTKDPINGMTGEDNEGSLHAFPDDDSTVIHA
jgi:hypothetical protein